MANSIRDSSANRSKWELDSPLGTEGQGKETSHGTDPLSRPERKIRCGSKPRMFPEVLHDIVMHCSENCSDVMDWTSDGMGFVIKKRGELVKNVLPRFLPSITCLKSFQRQWQNYGFSCQRKQCGRPCRRDDELFHRDYPDRAKAIPKKKKAVMEREADRVKAIPKKKKAVTDREADKLLQPDVIEHKTKKTPLASAATAKGVASVFQTTTTTASTPVAMGLYMSPSVREARTIECKNFGMALYLMVDHCETYHKDVLQFGEGGYNVKVLKPEYFESHILGQFFPRTDLLPKWERRLKGYNFSVERFDGEAVCYRHNSRLFHRDDVTRGAGIRKMSAARKMRTDGSDGHAAKKTRRTSSEKSAIRKRSRAFDQEWHNCKRVKADARLEATTLTPPGDVAWDNTVGTAPVVATGLSTLAAAADLLPDTTTTRVETLAHYPFAHTFATRVAANGTNTGIVEAMAKEPKILANADEQGGGMQHFHNDAG